MWEIGALGAAPKVLALGGGAVLSDDVRRALGAVAHVVWLTAPAAELWRRVTRDAGSERPLARDEHAFATLLAAREPLYRLVATLVVETSGREAGDVAAGLARLVRVASPPGRPEGTPGTPREGAA
jgi:shikimate kinase